MQDANSGIFNFSVASTKFHRNFGTKEYLS